jgi:hypothetical protein
MARAAAGAALALPLAGSAPALLTGRPVIGRHAPPTGLGLDIEVGPAGDELLAREHSRTVPLLGVNGRLMGCAPPDGSYRLR